MKGSLHTPPPIETAAVLAKPVVFLPSAPAGSKPRYIVALADDQDRQEIARLRHEVYASELGQHPTNIHGRLGDGVDGYNVMLVVRIDERIAGFVSVTPPGRGPLSIDKYFARSARPFTSYAEFHEVRLLTILKNHRGRDLAGLLMFAALRWIESHGGTGIVAIGRREVIDLYLHVGFRLAGPSTKSGAVTYDLMSATVGQIRESLTMLGPVLNRLEARSEWRLSFAFHKPAACFHGGIFFSAIGESFDDLNRRRAIINADVLDAWFPPAPGVVSTLKEHLPWLLGTSPPSSCGGLIAAIADARGVRPENILPGAGSSDLIFRTLCEWLTPQSRVLILDPTYGEYAHVLNRVIGCRVNRLSLSPEKGYQVDIAALEAALRECYDLVILVNPNSPTGRHVGRRNLESILNRAPVRTRIWVDETYVEYVGPDASLERFAAASENVVVCKSMSKVYALSGARVAYLCSGPHQLETLRAITPPWIVGLPSQVAAVRALQDPCYYAERYAETALYREAFAFQMRVLEIDVLPGVANFLLCRLPFDGPDSETLTTRCRKHGLFIRNAGSMGNSIGDRVVRIAVKDRETNARIVSILKCELQS